MDEEGTRPRRSAAPKGLETEGKRLWRSVVARYDLRPDELAVLENACRCADVVAKLTAAMEGQPLTTKGSMGQQREHPLLSEQRLQRVLLNRSLAQLRLPDLAGAAPMTASMKARAAARARWTPTVQPSRWAQTHGEPGA